MGASPSSHMLPPLTLSLEQAAVTGGQLRQEVAEASVALGGRLLSSQLQEVLAPFGWGEGVNGDSVGPVPVDRACSRELRGPPENPNYRLLLGWPGEQGALSTSQIPLFPSSFLR